MLKEAVALDRVLRNDYAFAFCLVPEPTGTTCHVLVLADCKWLFPLAPEEHFD
jgi:hypothetical protein